MSVVDRSALEASPLADLHAIASELSIDGYRRLRRPELIDAILNKQEGSNRGGAATDDVEAAADAQAPPPKRTRSRRGAKAAEAAESSESSEATEAAETEPETETTA